jgi:hypothetical protein
MSETKTAFGELKRNEEEDVEAYFKVLSRHSPGWTEKNYENRQ